MSLSEEKIILSKANAMAEVFKALGDPNRLRIIGLLASRKGESFCVNDLADWLEISQPAVSQHLRVLKNIGLLNPNRKGFHVYYAIDIEKFQEIKVNFDFLSKVAVTPCDEKEKVKGC